MKRSHWFKVYPGPLPDTVRIVFDVTPDLPWEKVADIDRFTDQVLVARKRIEVFPDVCAVYGANGCVGVEMILPSTVTCAELLRLCTIFEKIVLEIMQ